MKDLEMFDELLERHLAGECTPEESERVRAALSENARFGEFVGVVRQVTHDADARNLVAAMHQRHVRGRTDMPTAAQHQNEESRRPSLTQRAARTSGLRQRASWVLAVAAVAVLA